ncbi:MAG: hypothetical protein M3R04_05615 [bacterium]|nr:hypothetical protein [bacterium]
MRLLVLLAVFGLLASCKQQKLPGSTTGLNVYPEWVELTPASELHLGSDDADPLRCQLSIGDYPEHWPKNFSLEALGTIYVANFSERGNTESRNRGSEFKFITGLPVEELIGRLRQLHESNGFELNFDGTTWGKNPGSANLTLTSVTGYRQNDKTMEAVLFLIFREPALGDYSYVRARYSEIPYP